MTQRKPLRKATYVWVLDDLSNGVEVKKYLWVCNTRTEARRIFALHASNEMFYARLGKPARKLLSTVKRSYEPVSPDTKYRQSHYWIRRTVADERRRFGI